MSAQANPESGDVAVPAEASASGSASGTASATTSWPSPAASAEASSDTSGDADLDTTDTGGGDHAAVVSHLGVGFFGVMGIPVAGTDMNPTDDEVDAPTIGVRYWLDDMLGIEAALGLNISSLELGGGTEASIFGLGLHGGVPLAIASSGHFVFEIVPFLNFGIASSTVETTMGMMTSEDDHSGLLIEVGGRVGAEIHFGFIDLPSLSLQGTVGLSVRHEGRSVTPAGGMETSFNSTVVSTNLQDEPWDIFTGSITAIYYL